MCILTEEKKGLSEVKQPAQWQNQDSDPELSKAQLYAFYCPLLPLPTEGSHTKEPEDVGATSLVSCVQMGVTYTQLMLGPWPWGSQGGR